MKSWKENKVTRPDIFPSEIKLKTVSKEREIKVKKLIKLLGGTDVEALS